MYLFNQLKKFHCANLYSYQNMKQVKRLGIHICTLNCELKNVNILFKKKKAELKSIGN